MKRERQHIVLELINAKRISTQQELAEELARRGIMATQSSISRDIVELGLTKVNGYYTAPAVGAPATEQIIEIETAGDNLIVIKTAVGQAQPAALTIDRAKISEIVGTVAGDDTILIAVKNLAAQRAAIKRINKLFARPALNADRRRSRAARPADQQLWQR